MLAEPAHAYVIDLQAPLTDDFFRLFRDIGFDEAAEEAGLTISVYFMLDRALTSVQAMERISRLLGRAHLVPVRNEAIGDVLLIPQAAFIYKGIHKSRELLLPRLSLEALDLIDEPDFTFAEFIARNGAGVSPELRTELWNFLVAVYDQRRSDREGGNVVL